MKKSWKYYILARRDTMSGPKVEFKEAHCVEYTESFNSTDNEPLKIHYTAKRNLRKGTTLRTIGQANKRLLMRN
jgi:hypothetical protein